MPLDRLAQSQLERRIKPLRGILENTKVLDGWIKTVRTTFSITQNKLGELAGGIGKASVHESEEREIEGKIQLETLRKFAHAMDCELIYAFVPKMEIDKLYQKKAREKAKRLIESGNLHMELEGERVPKNLIEFVAANLMMSGDVW